MKYSNAACRVSAQMACWDINLVIALCLSVHIQDKDTQKSNGAVDPDFLMMEELGMETPNECQPQS